MENWLKLNPSSMNKKTMENIRGVEVTVFVSPHNVPEAVRGFYDEEKGRFAIEFRYLDEQEKEVSSDTHNPLTKVFLGEKSRRVYRVEIDVDAIRANRVALKMAVPEELKKTLEALKARYAPQTQNYDVVEDVVCSEEDRLMEPLYA